MLTRSRMGVTRGKTMVPMSTRGRTMLPKAGGSTDLESRPGARKEPHAAKLCFQPGKTMRQVTTGGTFVAESLPSILFGSLAGVFVYRWDRRRTMIVAALLRGILILE